MMMMMMMMTQRRKKRNWTNCSSWKYRHQECQLAARQLLEPPVTRHFWILLKRAILQETLSLFCGPLSQFHLLNYFSVQKRSVGCHCLGMRPPGLHPQSRSCWSRMTTSWTKCYSKNCSTNHPIQNYHHHHHHWHLCRRLYSSCFPVVVLCGLIPSVDVHGCVRSVSAVSKQTCLLSE